MTLEARRHAAWLGEDEPLHDCRRRLAGADEPAGGGAREGCALRRTGPHAVVLRGRLRRALAAPLADEPRCGQSGERARSARAHRRTCEWMEYWAEPQNACDT